MVQEKSTEQVKNPPTWVFFVIAALGLWLLTSPASFHFQSTALVYSDLISGALLILLSMIGRSRPTKLILWTIAFVGIWIQFAPLLFWAPVAAVYFLNVLVGSMVIVFSVILFDLPNDLPNVEPTIPPGFSYNPSAPIQRLPIATLVFICWTISRYLATYQLGYNDTVWDPFFQPGTKAVLESSVSHFFPVSDAGLGALAYTVEFFSTCQGGKARWRTSPWLVLIFGILVIPLGLISMTLVILQPLIVGTWCTLCLATAICMLLMIPLAIDEVIASLQFLHRNGWKYLFSGGECRQAKEDTSMIDLISPSGKLCRAAVHGIKICWTHPIMIAAGVFLMAVPSIFSVKKLLFDLDPILGAFTVAAAVVSFAEKLHMAKWIGTLFALALFILSIVENDLLWIHIPLAIVIGAVSLTRRQG